MLTVSTVWNAFRDGGIAPAIRTLRTLGFEDVEIDLAGRGADVSGVAGTAAELRVGIRCADARPDAESPDDLDALGAAFSSPVASVREAHAAALLASAAAAKRAGTNRVIVRCGVVPVPGAGGRFEDWGRRASLAGVTDEIRAEVAAVLAARDRLRDVHLEAACRTLHLLVRADPETDWWILPAARPDALPLPDEAEHLLAELPPGRPAFVHDAAAAQVLADLGVVPATRWLRDLDSRLAALRLSDSFGLATGLPPGAGSVDWASVGDAASRALPRVLRLAPGVEPGEVVEGARILRARGLG